MILRLSTQTSRILILSFSLIFGIAISYLGIRNAIAAHALGQNTKAGYEKAVRLEPGNSNNWFLLGHYLQYNLEQPEPERALRALQASLYFDPHSIDSLLDIAAAYEDQDDSAKADEYFRKARQAYPASSEVSWRYGNFLLRQARLPAAFAEFRHAAEGDPKRGAEAFSRCRRLVPDVNEILDKAIPVNAKIYAEILGNLAAEGQLDDALTVWSRINALPVTVDPRDLYALTNALIQRGRAADAREYWQQAVKKMNIPSTGDLPKSVIWDGGFESGVNGGGFAWHFEPEYKGVQAAFDTQEKHSGQHSLRLVFTGRNNVDFADVCHWAAVDPGRTYEFSGWVRPQAISSDQGVRFRFITFTGGIPIISKTDDVHGESGWTKITRTWTAPPDIPLVQVCVSRDTSGQGNGEIQGIAWVDDVSLVPAAESPKP